MLCYIRCFLLMWVLLLVPKVYANEQSTSIQAALVQEDETIQPGQPFWVALHLNMEDGWHVYWKNPGEAGLPLQVKWQLPEGFEAGPLQWPFPKKFTTADMVGFGYEGEVVLLSLIQPPKHLTASEISLQATIDWLVCSASTCQPGSNSLKTTLQVQSTKPKLRSDQVQLFTKARQNLPQTKMQVKTVRKQGLVQLQLLQEERIGNAEAIKKIYFFPEQQNIIDYSIDPTIAQAENSKDHYYVNLKESDEIGAKSHILKGVLVVHKNQGLQEIVEAFDVNSPIGEESDNYLLSAIDPASISKNFATVGDQATVSAPADLAFEGGLGLALVFAFIGGILLNLMPCVLPVISFKVMSFVKMAGQDRSLILKHGLTFTAGVILSFWLLASVMLVLRAYGQSVGWGFQLQEPIFVIILSTLLFIFALNLFGVFEWGLSVSSWAGQTQSDQAQKQPGDFSSFLSGCLATAVATPCTGPFLGSAVGFAVTLPVFQAMSIFTVLGLGMSFPYVLLSFFPSCLRFLPKPGPWMETFKQLMGFLLLATVLWLLWVFSAQTDNFSLICLLAGFLFFALGAWCYGQGSAPLISRQKRLFIYATVVLLAVVGVKAILLPRASWTINTDNVEIAHQEKPQEDWEVFSPERVAELRAQGIPVFIDFTAKWCLSCQVNHTILESKDVSQHLAELGVVKMKADWTKKDPVITKELSKLGRNSVPLYVFYGAEKEKDPVLLPQILTPDSVIKGTTESSNKQIALE
jgi:thiol:disulfide interchange protein